MQVCSRELCESTQPLSPCWHSLTLLEHLNHRGVTGRGGERGPWASTARLESLTRSLSPGAEMSPTYLGSPTLQCHAAY